MFSDFHVGLPYTYRSLLHAFSIPVIYSCFLHSCIPCILMPHIPFSFFQPHPCIFYLSYFPLPHFQSLRPYDHSFTHIPALDRQSDRQTDGQTKLVKTISHLACTGMLTRDNKKLSWCWQTRAMRLEVSQGRHQTYSISPYVRYTFLLCNSNFDFKTCRFSDIRRQKMLWPWNPGQRSPKVIESGILFDRLHMVSYVLYCP